MSDDPLNYDSKRVEELRKMFVHDFQYRYHKQSDHYTVVAIFAAHVEREALKNAK